MLAVPELIAAMQLDPNGLLELLPMASALFHARNLSSYREHLHTKALSWPSFCSIERIYFLFEPAMGKPHFNPKDGVME